MACKIYQINVPSYFFWGVGEVILYINNLTCLFFFFGLCKKIYQLQDIFLNEQELIDVEKQKKTNQSKR